MTADLLEALAAAECGSELFPAMPGSAKPGQPARAKGLYAALPGSGPAGETCGSCMHIYRNRRYRKCMLLRPQWTHGPGTDIKARTPACSKWQAIATRDAGRHGGGG